MNITEISLTCNSCNTAISCALFTGSIAAAALMIAFGPLVIRSQISHLEDQPGPFVGTDYILTLIVAKNISLWSFIISNIAVLFYWLKCMDLILIIGLIVFCLGLVGLIILGYNLIISDKRIYNSIVEHNKRYR